MPPSREQYIEFLKHQESVPPTPTTSIDTALGMIKTAAVSFDHLTNSPEWDRYLSIVQEKYESATKQQEDALHNCANSASEADMRRWQVQYQFYTGVTSTLKEILALPHQVMESYQALKK